MKKLQRGRRRANEVLTIVLVFLFEIETIWWCTMAMRTDTFFSEDKDA